MNDDNKTIADALKELEAKTADRSEVIPLLKQIERNTAKGVSAVSTSIGVAVEKAVAKAAIKSEKRQKVSVANKRQLQASTAIVASSKTLQASKKQSVVPIVTHNSDKHPQVVTADVSPTSTAPAVQSRDKSGKFTAKTPPKDLAAGQKQEDQNDKLASILKDAVMQKKEGLKDVAGKLAFGPLWDVGKELKEAADSMQDNAKDEKSTMGRMKKWGKGKLGIKDKTTSGPAAAANGTAQMAPSGGGPGMISQGKDLHDLWKNRKGVRTIKPGRSSAPTGSARGGMMARGSGVMRAGTGAAGSLAKMAGPLLSGISLPLVAAAGAAAFGVQQFTQALTTGESTVNTWFKKITGLDAGKETQADRDKAAKSEADNLANINRGRAAGTEIVKTDDGRVVRADAKKNMELTAQELRKKGMSEEMVTATLANVQKESGGISRTENMNYKNQSNDRIRTIFGSSVKGKTDEEITALKNGPEDQFAEAMYGKGTKKGRDMGNTEAGDGYKFRGRGLVQLTGKANYASMSQKLYGDDRLVKNPELANDSETAAKITAQYMSDRQKSAAKKLGLSTNTTNQDEANKIATQAVMGTGVDINGKRAQEQLATVQTASRSALVQNAVKATAGGKTVEPPSREQVASSKPQPAKSPAKAKTSTSQKASGTGPVTSQVVPTEPEKKTAAVAATVQPKQAEKAAAADNKVVQAEFRTEQSAASQGTAAMPAEKQYGAGDVFAERKKIDEESKAKKTQMLSDFRSGKTNEDEYIKAVAAEDKNRVSKKDALTALSKKAESGQWITQAEMDTATGKPAAMQTATVAAVSAVQPPLPQPQPVQAPPPQPVDVPGIEKLAAAAASNTKPANKSSDGGKKTPTPNIKTDFDDTMLVLMSYDRI